MVDITGRTQSYDEMLFSSLRDNHLQDVTFLSPKQGLISLLPRKYRSSLHPFKRIIKMIECFANYILISFKLLSKTDVLHLQWLPFIEISGVEYYILFIYKHLSSKLKIVLTVHNIYPHDLNEKDVINYRKRFAKINRIVDAYIVHTVNSKSELSVDFNIDKNKIHICPHGVFMPLDINMSRQNTEKSDKFHILMFGVHSYYKGTDILVEAINKLTDDFRMKVDVHIVGLMDKDYYNSLKKLDNSEVIDWKNYYLSDEELGEEISRCDIIVLPYRKISQSGVLLMAINCSRLIICSDIPSFKETLHGSDNDCSYDQDLFFKSGDSDSLCTLLEKHIKRQVSINEILKRMAKLAKENTWEKSAEKTVEVYRRVLC